MGSTIITNDSLQLTREQGFPVELEYQKHLAKPFQDKDFAGRIFEFKDKPMVRVYQAPPVRVFLIENHDGKWIYWGLVHVTEVRHDQVNKTTSGKFKIIHIYSPEEMKMAHDMIDRNPETKFVF